MRIASIVAAVFAALIGLTVMFGSWYTVDQGERGVILRNGAIVGTAQPGLSFKTPMIEDVVKVSVQTSSRRYEGVAVYSKDQQPAVVNLSVTYRIPADQVAVVYEQFGGEDGLKERLLDRRVFETFKTIFGQFNAVTAIQERARLNKEVTQAIEDSIQGPIFVESVQIEDISFSDAYEASIEERMLAEVEVQRLRQNAEREKVQAQITVTQAEAKADAVRAEAQAAAEAIRIRGDAEAASIRARGEALRDNPALVDLTQAERWNGQLPSTMVPGGSVPMLGIK